MEHNHVISIPGFFCVCVCFFFGEPRMGQKETMRIREKKADGGEMDGN